MKRPNEIDKDDWLVVRMFNGVEARQVRRCGPKVLFLAGFGHPRQVPRDSSQILYASGDKAQALRVASDLSVAFAAWDHARKQIEGAARRQIDEITATRDAAVAEAVAKEKADA